MIIVIAEMVIEPPCTPTCFTLQPQHPTANCHTQYPSCHRARAGVPLKCFTASRSNGYWRVLTDIDLDKIDDNSKMGSK